MRHIGFLLLLLFPSLASAVTLLSRELADCYPLTSEVGRLACYDRIVERHQYVPVELARNSENRRVSQWQIRFGKNPARAIEDVWLSSPAVDFSIASDATLPILEMQCVNDRTDLTIHWGRYLDDNPTVWLRVDERVPQKASWVKLEGSRSARYPQSPIAWMKTLVSTDARKVAAEVTPYGQAKVTAVFDLEGLSDVLPRLRKACHW